MPRVFASTWAMVIPRITCWPGNLVTWSTCATKGGPCCERHERDQLRVRDRVRRVGGRVSLRLRPGDHGRGERILEEAIQPDRRGVWIHDRQRRIGLFT